MGAVQDVMRRPGAAEIVHPNRVVLQPPKNVSPYIRFCRYAALSAGIVYGFYRYEQLKKQHIQVREYEHQQLMADLAMQAKIKNWMYLEEMEKLFGEIGLEWSPKFRSQFGIHGDSPPK